MKGLCSLFVTAKMVPQSMGKTKFRKKKKGRGEEQGEKGRGKEGGREAGQVLLAKENLNGFGWGLVQPQQRVHTGGEEKAI